MERLNQKKESGSRYSQLLILIFLAITLFQSCSKEDVVPGLEIPDEIKSVNNFIWDNMDFYYFWREYMPTDLDPNAQPDPAVSVELGDRFAVCGLPGEIKSTGGSRQGS